MTLKHIAAISFSIAVGLIMLFFVLQGTVFAATYPWGVHQNRVPASQPSGTPASNPPTTASGPTLSGTTAAASLNLSQTQFDAWVETMRGNSYFEPYIENGQYSWIGQWTPIFSFFSLGTIVSVTPTTGGFITCTSGYSVNAIDFFMGNGYTVGSSGSGGTCFYPVADPSVDIIAVPPTIDLGSTSTLIWNAENVMSCYITSGSTLGPMVAGDLPPAGEIVVTPTETTRYYITCLGGMSAAIDSTVVVVNDQPFPPVTVGCSAFGALTGTDPEVVWIATATDGESPDYTYSWSGTDGLSGSTMTVSKTYATPGVKQGTVTVTSGAGSASATCLAVVNVIVAEPDLTASSVTPTSATTGTPVTLTAAVTNGGSETTSAGFTSLFQRATNSSGSGATDIGTDTSPALSGGANDSISRSYTFSSAGTYYVRACADKSSASNSGTIVESNENNNCGPWTSLTVTEEEPVPVGALSCVVSNSNPTIGQAVTYTASGASAPYTWTPSDGVGSYGTGSTANRTFSANGSYGMMVSKSGYTSGNCPVVLVGEPGCGTADAAITATPDRVRADNNSGVTLNFSASGVDTSCTISGPGVSQTVTPNACLVGSQSIQTPQITQQSIYRINCDSGESVEEVVVNLIPRFDEF